LPFFYNGVQTLLLGKDDGIYLAYRGMEPFLLEGVEETKTFGLEYGPCISSKAFECVYALQEAGKSWPRVNAYRIDGGQNRLSRESWYFNPSGKAAALTIAKDLCI